LRAMCSNRETIKIFRIEEMRNWDFIKQIINGPFCKDPKVLSMLKRYIANPTNENMQSLSRFISPKILHQKIFGKPFPEPDEQVDGQLRFALTEEGKHVGINLDEPHCLIVGQTGCGKTYLLLSLLGQIL
jgi:hypothetical protein